MISRFEKFGRAVVNFYGLEVVPGHVFDEELHRFQSTPYNIVVKSKAISCLDAYMHNLYYGCETWEEFLFGKGRCNRQSFNDFIRNFKIKFKLIFDNNLMDAVFELHDLSRKLIEADSIEELDVKLTIAGINPNACVKMSC